ncbi:outer membrane beta-barrel protein [Aquicoccus sp. G2-2]|uniref:outer membrane beta-barrel protein n=1 Tax=Aquicoccus sp. G2-2 TaxID=3092120 RepID=UPI002ADF896B|nr:outer membrane beta-barrel protein [Aquicoccus sp. G2-2]MEA1112542.1 hypothetical protein [Aquicoccus sp. G2-2]
MKHSIALCALMGSLAAAPSVQADGFYFGLGLGGTSAKSDAVFGGLGTSELKTAVVGLTGGYRWALASGFAAAELDADISLESAFKNTATGATCPTPGSTGAYYCKHDATVRLRGIYGMPLAGGWEGYGALGYGVVMGDSGTSGITAGSAMNGGVSLGLGAQKTMGDGKLRIELNHDKFDNVLKHASGSPFEGSYRATSLKATYLFGF